MVHDAGVGRHLVAVMRSNPAQITAWAKSLYALEWLYLSSVALPKISILCLFLRIFTDRGARITTYVLIAIVAANWFVWIIAATFQCSPVPYQWDKTIKDGSCFNVSAFYKASSAPNIATDAVILVLPVPTVWRLKATKIRKLGITFVFLAGSMSVQSYSPFRFKAD